MTDAHGEDDSEATGMDESDESDTERRDGSQDADRNDTDSSDELGEDERTDGDGDREPTRSGRRLVAVVFVGSVLLAGGFGYFIGSIGPRALGSISVFGLTVFEPTPVGMALYGMTVTGLVLGILFVGAHFALRRESEGKQASRGR
ncbi:hypothetical protein BRC86_05205 [Halobacteriales archaeon QS_3_64_16]|nr:MAG: hypothetical protein BRC86_05205 [Halobacteriales archaeon QS_3_64_16]